jgi:hypothetical protein
LLMEDHQLMKSGTSKIKYNDNTKYK